MPGRRSAAWRKIKPVHLLPCVVVGFVPGRAGFRRLLVAAVRDGSLQYVASLRSGFSNQVRAHLQAWLTTRLRSQPVVACPYAATWVEPALYCQVRFLDWTRAGRLRGASFHRLLDTPPANLCPTSG